MPQNKIWTNWNATLLLSLLSSLSLTIASSNGTGLEDDCILGNFTYLTKIRVNKTQPISRIQCQKKLSNPSGALLLRILLLDLPPGCENNSLQLFEQHQHSNKLTLRAKFCRTSPLYGYFTNIIIRSGQVLVEFKTQTPTSGSDGSFVIHYYPYSILGGIYDSYCSQDNSPQQNANIIRTSRKGDVTSHLKHVDGSSYPPGMFCRWIIVPTNVTNKEQIKIRFYKFDFSKGYDKDCAQDHVQFDFGNGRIQKYCKATGNPSVIYSSNAKSVNVTFVSTPLYTGNDGFSFEYTVVPIDSAIKKFLPLPLLLLCGFVNWILNPTHGT